MNNLLRNLLRIIVVFIAFLAIRYYPDLWIDIAFAVPAAFLVEFFYRNSEKYASLQWLNSAKEKYHEYMRKKRLKHAIDNEQYDEYEKKLLENAISKAFSTDKNLRKIGLEQLSQFGTKDSIDKLLEMLKNGKDKSYEEDIIKTICTILRGM